MIGPYYKSKLEQKSNSSERRENEEHKTINCKFICVYIFFFVQKADIRTSSLNIVSLTWSRTTDKLEINWSNFTRVRLQLKFALSCSFTKRLKTKQSVNPAIKQILSNHPDYCKIGARIIHSTKENLRWIQTKLCKLIVANLLCCFPIKSRKGQLEFLQSQDGPKGQEP